MAQVPYEGGVPTVAPDATPPNDYIHAEANPAESGALIAQGMEKVGQGAVVAQKFFGQIQTDDLSNQYQNQAAGLLEHVKSLQGQDALNAQDGFKKDLSNLYDSYKGKLGSLEQQNTFENQNRAFTDRYITGQANDHFIRQGQEYGLKTTDDATLVANTMAANAGSRGDEATLAVARAKALDAAAKRLALTGQENNPDAHAQALQSANAVYKSYAEALAATGPGGAGRAMQFIQKPDIQQALGPLYAPLYKELKEGNIKDTGNAANVEAAHAVSAGWTPGAVAPTVAKAPAGTLPPQVYGGYGPTFTQYNRDLNHGDVASALRLSEGLRMTPYWDVNHWRTGYGSDTVTRADGSVEPVTPFTRITPEDAERDLQRRTNLAAQSIQTQLGPETWGKMTPGTRNALVSVYYNYGHLPEDIAKGAMSGDAGSLASAIAAHANDNDGVNAKRRMAEAGAVMGTFGASGPTAVQAPQAVAARDEAGASAAPASPEATFQPAAYQPPPAAPSGDSVPSAADADAMVAAADRAHALRLQYIGGMDLDPDSRRIAVAQAENDYKVAILGIDATKSEQQHAYTAATDKYLSALKTEGPVEVYQELEADKTIDENHKELLKDIIERRTGTPDAKSMGPGYTASLDRILSSPKDPGHIGSVRQILELERAGQISGKGADELMRSMKALEKSEDEVGLQTVRANGLKLLESRMAMGFDETGKAKNLRGLELYQTAGVDRYNKAFNDWRQAVKEGKGDDTFSLSDPKKFDAFLEGIYPRAQRDADLRAAINGDVKPPDSPAGDIDPDKWSLALATPPAQNGERMPGDVWAAGLTKLVSNPMLYGPKFDAANGQGAAKAALAQVGINYIPAAPLPENVGSTSETAIGGGDAAGRKIEAAEARRRAAERAELGLPPETGSR